MAVIGAGWAGCAAAVDLHLRGKAVTLFEAARIPGGRARALACEPGVQSWPAQLVLDNGQHIMIGAYSSTLELMRRVGVDDRQALLRLPLALVGPDGSGLELPDWPAPLDALWGIVRARGWTWRERAGLLRAAMRWQRMQFSCPPDWSVQRLCHNLPPSVMRDMIEPLTVSALNTPVAQASASVFLRVLRDAMFGPRGGSNLLLPRVDLGRLLPATALDWLLARGVRVRLGQRVQSLHRRGQALIVDGEEYDQVVLACPAAEASRLLASSGVDCADWLARAGALQHEPITTVYLHAPQARLPRPMLALPSSPTEPAQFAFDRGWLGGPPGLLALVVSASRGSREELAGQVLAQARNQLGLHEASVIQTVIEKRATFACTPGLQRPGMQPCPTLPALLVCADYVQGPYPATLEGAVRSGLAAAAALG